MYADTVRISFIGRWIGGSYRDTCGIDAAAGIKQLSVDTKQVLFYPNPNNGNFVIETNSMEKQTMQVYDVSGRLVFSQTINGKASIDASNLNEGVYNLSITTNEGVVNKRMVIVR
jgi:hypothetical protein